MRSTMEAGEQVIGQRQGTTGKARRSRGRKVSKWIEVRGDLVESESILRRCVNEDLLGDTKRCVGVVGME